MNNKYQVNKKEPEIDVFNIFTYRNQPLGEFSYSIYFLGPLTLAWLHALRPAPSQGMSPGSGHWPPRGHLPEVLRQGRQQEQAEKKAL